MNNNTYDSGDGEIRRLSLMPQLVKKMKKCEKNSAGHHIDGKSECWTNDCQRCYSNITKNVLFFFY